MGGGALWQGPGGWCLQRVVESAEAPIQVDGLGVAFGYFRQGRGPYQTVRRRVAIDRLRRFDRLLS